MNFYGCTKRELEDILAAEGVSRVHAKELFRRAYGELRLNPFSGFPAKKVAVLGEKFSFDLPEISLEHHSKYDSSQKFLITLSDGKKIEAVLMPEKTRITLCLSSQVGCAQACAFCHTGRMGLDRQLRADEIVAQVLLAKKWILEHKDWAGGLGLDPERGLTNVVFMGMGEPLDNTPEVFKAIEIMQNHFGLRIAKRKITVSTAGQREGLERFMAENIGVSLALSVHSVKPQMRNRIMPINRSFPLETLWPLVKEYTEKTKKEVLIQYTLFEGINDSTDDASELVDALMGIPAKINVIPYNIFSGSAFKAPSEERVAAFVDTLFKRGVRPLVRYSKGQDIAAGCGTLFQKVGG